MTHSFSRRLATQSFLAIGGSLALGAIAVAGGILAADIAVLNTQSAAAIARAPALLAASHIAKQDARGAMRILIAQPDIAPLRVWTVNETMRVAAVRQRHRLALRTLPRTETEFAPRPIGTRLAVAMGTGFGLQLRRAQFGQLYIYITADEEAFKSSLLIGCCALAACIGLGALYAWLAAASLTRRALLPLIEVASALEGFAAGDFRPRPVDLSSSDRELRRLTVAVNAAMLHVSEAFRERDDAQSRMRRFIADAAHQLRTPLTVIAGFVGIMKASAAETPSERARILATIDGQTHVIAELVSKLTLLERWDDATTEREIVHAGELVRDVVLPFAAANPQRSFDLACACDGYIAGDPREFEEAFSNVIDNAVKYGAPAAVAVTVEASAAEVTIVISDAGRGMSATNIRRAFDRFYRGDDRDIVGSGLGLAIAQRVIERAGGIISIESRLGAGTAVRIRLPRVASRAAPIVKDPIMRVSAQPLTLTEL